MLIDLGPSGRPLRLGRISQIQTDSGTNIQQYLTAAEAQSMIQVRGHERGEPTSTDGHLLDSTETQTYSCRLHNEHVTAEHLFADQPRKCHNLAQLDFQQGNIQTLPNS